MRASEAVDTTILSLIIKISSRYVAVAMVVTCDTCPVERSIDYKGESEQFLSEHVVK